MPHLSTLRECMIKHYADPKIGELCSCNRSCQRTTRCHDCKQYTISCSECFLDAHRNNPFHWAHVWDNAAGFFIRRDISLLRSDWSLHLGHGGNQCPHADSSILFTVIDGNGIHGTRLTFCECPGCLSHIEQLMDARLFPASTREPRTAYTFNILKEFHLHNLESKKAAYDYLGALRRLTNNAFTADVPVRLHAFLTPTSSLTIHRIHTTTFYV